MKNKIGKILHCNIAVKCAKGEEVKSEVSASMHVEFIGAKGLTYFESCMN